MPAGAGVNQRHGACGAFRGDLKARYLVAQLERHVKNCGCCRLLGCQGERGFTEPLATCGKGVDLTCSCTTASAHHARFQASARTSGCGKAQRFLAGTIGDHRQRPTTGDCFKVRHHTCGFGIVMRQPVGQPDEAGTLWRGRQRLCERIENGGAARRIRRGREGGER